MPLECGCGNDYDYGEYDWYYSSDELDFQPLATKRRLRCKSCKTLIDIGATVLKFDRWRFTKDDIEIKIRGEGTEILLAGWYLCESCGEAYLNLDAIGFCVQPDEDMNKLMIEYRKMDAERREYENRI